MEEIKIDELIIRYDNDRVFIIKPDAVLIIPVFEGKIGLIQISRNPLDLKNIEIPGGRIMVNESPYEAAKRELFEETGIDNVLKIEFIRTIYPLPSICDEKVHIFVAHIGGLKELSPQISEGISRVYFVGVDEISRILRTNEITSSTDMCALYLYKDLVSSS